MMWGMGTLLVLGFVLLVLAIAALAKYLFFNKRGENGRHGNG